VVAKVEGIEFGSTSHAQEGLDFGPVRVLERGLHLGSTSYALLMH